MSRWLLLSFGLVVFAFPSLGSAREPRTDHPLVSPYEGSTIKRKKTLEFDEYQAFTGMDETGKTPTGLPLEGRITKILYMNPKQRSILEMFRNYEQAVTQAGAEILYTCNQKQKECVERYAGPTLQKFSDIHSISNLDGRYLLAKIQQSDHTAYVAIAVGPVTTSVHVIEVKAMETGKASLDAAALGAGLEAKGFVVLEGLYFETDQDTLKPTSDPALAEIAKLLQERPSLAVYVVGHTDGQGPLAHNQNLSERRARAIVDALATRHGIDRGRMSGHGVGPLAPKASNDSESGRALNRRVELRLSPLTAPSGA